MRYNASMTQYTMLSFFTTAELSKKVTELLAAGRNLYGEPKVVMAHPMQGTPQGSAIFIQALTK